MTSSNSADDQFAEIFLSLIALGRLYENRHFTELLELAQEKLKTAQTLLVSFREKRLIYSLIGTLYSYEGLAHRSLGNHEQALVSGEHEVAASHSALAGSDLDADYGLARAYANLGLAKHELGDFVGAQADYQTAIDLSKRLTAQDDVLNLRRQVLSHMAQLQFERGEMQEAKTNWLRSSLSYSSLPEGSPEDILALNDIATSAMVSGDYERAEQLYRRALNHAGQADKIDHHMVGLLHCNLGMTLWKKGTPEQAISEMEKACLFHRHRAGSKGALATDLNNLGTYFGSLGRFDDAGRVLKEAWDLIREDNPNSRVALSILRSLAVVRVMQGDGERSRAILLKGMEIYEAIRPKVALSEAGHEGLFHTFRALVELMLFSSLHEGWLDEVFLLIERAKARFWQEELARLSAEDATSVRPDFATGLADAHSASDKCSEDPGVSQNQFIDSVDQIKMLNGHNGLLVHYFVGDSAVFLSYAYNRVLGAQRIDIKGDTLLDLIKTYRDHLADPQARLNHSSCGQQLADLLIKPISIEDWRVRHMVIMPDGPLWYLPFELLPFPHHEDTVEENHSLLIHHVGSIDYAPSATILEQLQKREAKTARQQPKSFLIVADPDIPPELPPLPGTQMEADALRNLLHPNEVHLLTGSRATKDNFQGLIPGQTHIHIAAHAVSDYEVSTPFIVLAGTSKEDFLYAPEISTTQISAELVFLSACSSSVAKISIGEGVMSLARAFLLAGCRCVIASLWPVSDFDTPRFVELFYRRFISGEPAAVALRNAKIQFAEQGGAPRTWGAFLAVGSGDTLENRFSVNHVDIQKMFEDN